MEEHRKELAGIRVYICKTCNKEFKTSVHLKEHMKSHAKMRSGEITDLASFSQVRREIKGTFRANRFYTKDHAYGSL